MIYHDFFNKIISYLTNFFRNFFPRFTNSVHVVFFFFIFAIPIVRVVYKEHASAVSLYWSAVSIYPNLTRFKTVVFHNKIKAENATDFPSHFC